MQETGNNTTKRPQMTLRVGSASLVFAMADNTAVKGLAYEPFTVKSGISMAANLREAFRTATLPGRESHRVTVMIDSPVMQVPIEEFDAAQAEVLYSYTFTGKPGSTVMHSILPTLNAVALFEVNKDLKTVIDDHYAEARFIPVEQPVWNYLHHRSYTDLFRRMYAYFHDNKVSVFAFDKNRFKFYNCFDASHTADCAYYMLHVWKQLQLDSEKDELHIAGSHEDIEELRQTLRRYLRKVYCINPGAEFNRAPITEIKGIPLDLATLYLKGR